MTYQIADRVQETTATTGTGTVSLAGATTGHQGFVAGIGNGNQTYYLLTSGTSDWEVGLGTVTSGSPDTLSRAPIASSNSNAAITLSGTSNVSCVAPAAILGPLVLGQRGQVLIATGSGAPSLRNSPANSAWKDPVQVATTGALPACTYNNGSSGIGATLTANANGALTIDGVSVSSTTTVLVKNQAAGLQNGIYTCTQTGDGSHPFILTRREDFDSTLNVNTGMVVAVLSGTVNSLLEFMCSSANSPTIGTTSLPFLQLTGSSASGTVGPADFSISSISDKDILVWDNSTSKWKNQRSKYVVACAALSGVLTSSQKLLYHRFTKAVTFPANFGSYLGHNSEAGGSANATGSTVINVDKAATASPNTFSNVGTITIASASVTPTFATSGGATVSFAQGDVLRIVGPSSADATFADFYASLVGFET